MKYLKLTPHPTPTPLRRPLRSRAQAGLAAGLILAFGMQPVASLHAAPKSARAGKSTAAQPSHSAVVFKNWGLASSASRSLPASRRSDIQAQDAWQITQGSSDVVVAVIDTGIDPEHKSLRGNLWKDTSAKQPVYGWDFTQNTANPADRHGHGTHVAGIIGAALDQYSGTSGVAQKVSLMPVKYYAENNSGAVNLKNTVAAINFAIDHGARVINYSGGGPEFSEEEYLAIRRAESKGILFVAAAGNDHRDIDQLANYYYPSAYRLSNIISVAAIDPNNQLLRSSNWGARKVDVAAPGERIYSTVPGNKFDYMSGTSQATAFVTGLAALALAVDPNLSPTDIRELIVRTSDKLPSLAGKVASSGRINAYAALLELKERETLKRAGRPGLLAAKRPGNLMRQLFSE